MFRTLAVLALFAAPVRADDKPKPNALTAKEIADGWIMLFDGETTFGWEAGSRFVTDEAKVKPKVTNGALVVSGGEGKAGARVFQSTTFADYEMSFEVMRNGPSGASVGIEVLHRTATGESGAAQSGRVVDSSLCPKSGEWYPVSVTASTGRGNTYTYAYADSKDKPIRTQPNPKVSLQYSSRLAISVEPKGEVLLRNIKLRPLGAQPLFNGKDLTGWKVNDADPKRAASKWSVTKDGELAVKDGPGDLVCEKEFANFVLQFECKTNGKALNSGIFFRCIPGQYQNGYEAQIQNAYKDDDRTKPADFGTGAIYRRIAARKVVSNDNEWFTMTVAANGKHITTWVNGYQTVDWTDDRKENDNPRQGYRAAKGPLSIQGHDPTTDILFRNIRASELPSK